MFFVGYLEAMKKRFVVYLRVSTSRQGDSGLGLDAQRAAVENFVRSMNGQGEILKEFVEVESGKRVDRPVLAEAIRFCRETSSVLLVAKLCRLSRNLHFITTLQNSKIEFCAVDNPHATPFLIHILASVAEFERSQISTRTKEALTQAKARGVKLGNPRFEEAVPKAVAARQAIATERNTELRKVVQQTIKKTGLTKLADIAEALNLRGIKTPRGCAFSPTHIHRLLKAV